MDIQRLMELATGYWPAAALSAAVELAVFEKLGDGSSTAEQIASEIGSSLPHTEGLLDALAGMGVLTKEHDAYSIAPSLLPVLDPASSSCLLDALRFNADLYPLWGSLAHCVRTGKPVLPDEAHLGTDPSRTERFVRGMHSRAQLFAPALAEAIQLDKGVTQLLDVGAGPGTFSAELAQRHSGLRVTLFDLAPVLEVGRKIRANHPTRAQLTFSAGDYHVDTLPGPFDAVLFSGALHQERPEDARAILDRIRDALKPEGALYLVDLMLEENRTHPVFSALFSLNMMLMRTDGRVYTASTVSALLEESGYVVASSEEVAGTPYRMIRARVS